MNNSSAHLELELEEPIDRSEQLRAQQTELVKEIEALQGIIGSDYWKLLEKQIFQPKLKLLEEQLRNEDDTTKLLRLQGAVRQARHDFELDKLLSIRQQTLTQIRRQLNA